MIPEGEPLSVEQATAIYDILVAEAGASEHWRDDFMYHQTREFLDENRLIDGALGMGGKFWRRHRIYSRGETWMVSYYPEDKTPEREKLVEATNKALAAYNESEEDS